MVNPNAGGAGEGNSSKGDKGKGKITVMEDKKIDDNKGKGKMMIKTSKDDEMDEKLAESLHKQMLEIKAWKERSEEESNAKEGKEGEEEKEEEESKGCPEWDDDPLAQQLEEMLIHNLRASFKRAIEKIAANGYSMEQAEWAVLASGFYIGNNDITSNIVAAAMAMLSKTKEFDPSERYIFDSLESLANYKLVEMVNVVKQMKPHLTVGDAMWLLFLFDLNLTQAATEGQCVDPKGSSSSSSSTRDETVYDVRPLTTIIPEFQGAKRGRKGTEKVPASSRKVTMKTQRRIFPEKKATVPAESDEKDEVIAALTQRKKELERELQGWNDWTSEKVGQAAQKLRRNKEEKKMLRQEKEEAEADDKQWSQNEKKIYEMAVAVQNVKALMEMTNATLVRAHAEHSMMVKILEDSKLIISASNQNLKEIKQREQELLKQMRESEAEKRSLQKDVALLEAESAKLQQQIDKARKRQHEFEVLRQHEEREKIKNLEKLESLRRERQEWKEKVKMEEEKLRAKAEEEERVKELSAQICALKFGESSSSGKAKAAEANKKRERECVMCLNQDKTVVFLPCAHQVVCEDCNELHKRGGMKDCPICRTPIMQRINARFPPPKPHQRKP